MVQWHTQAGSITTDLNVKIDFTLPEIHATKLVTWNCHVDYSAKNIYEIILGRDISKALVFNLRLYYHIIEANCRPF